MGDLEKGQPSMGPPAEGSGISYSYKPAPVLEGFRTSRPVTRRYHSDWEYLCQWHGTTMQHNWKTVLGYAIYCIGMVLLQDVKCSPHEKGRCEIVSEDVASSLEMMFALWSVFTAYLFQSYVSASIGRFEATLGSVRGIQGRFNDLMLIFCSFLKDSQEAKEFLSVAVRLLSALPYVLYANPLLGGDKTLLEHTRNILREDEYEQLLLVGDSDKPYAVMEWVLMACLIGIEKDIFHGGDNVGFQVVSAVSRLRGAYASMGDFLDDAILPFPFVNLMLLNLLLISVFLPILLYPTLKFWIIPGATIYFWFLHGMVTFTILVNRPFTKLSGEHCPQPLINTHLAILEMTRAVAQRFPSGRDTAPASVKNAGGGGPRMPSPHYALET